MQEILKQLGDLVLGSIPTVIFFFILLGAYAVLVRKPLARVLADRHSRTGGAMDEARAAIAAAESKTADYEAKLRHARAEIFEARQARAKASSDLRDKALGEARTAAQARVASARTEVERTGAEARAQIEASTDALTGSILATILPNRRVAGTGVAQ